MSLRDIVLKKNLTGEKMLKKIQVFMFSVFLIGGLAVGFVSLKGLYLSYEASSWETVEGIITELKLLTTRGGHNPITATTTARHLKYSYTVKNKEYIGNKEYFGLVKGTNKETRGGYVKGAKVKVYYNPRQPDMSVLKPRSRRAIWLGLFIAIVFSGFGALGIYKIKNT